MKKLIAAVLMMVLVVLLSSRIGFADLAADVVGRWNSGTPKQNLRFASGQAETEDGRGM